MQTFSWDSISTDALLGHLHLKNGGQRKERKVAFERAHDEEHSTGGRLAHIIIEDNQKFTLPIIEEGLEPSVFEITQRPRSVLSLVYIVNMPGQQKNLSVFNITLQEGATAEIFMCIGHAAQSTIFLETNLKGMGSATRQRTVFWGSGADVYDIFSNTILDAPYTKAQVLAKGVLSDTAECRFDGALDITPNGRSAHGSLHEHTLLLSSHAKMHAVPGLNIATHEVQASHAASVTRINDEQLLYAASRGIAEHAAKRLITEGFLRTMFQTRDEQKTLFPIMREKCRHL